MPTYKLTYGVSRLDSDVDEVAEEASIPLYPAHASPMEEGRYEVSHAFTAKDDEDAIVQAREIMDISFMDIDIFSVSDLKGNTILTEEDDEE